MTPKLLGIFTLFAAMAFESLAQIALKIGSSGGSAILSPRYRSWAIRGGVTSSKVWITVGALLYTIEILLWTYVLHLLDLSLAFPLGSLSFVGVVVLSRIFLAERVGRQRSFGILCIIVGSLFMSFSYKG